MMTSQPSFFSFLFPAFEQISTGDAPGMLKTGTPTCLPSTCSCSDGGGTLHVGRDEQGLASLLR